MELFYSHLPHKNPIGREYFRKGKKTKLPTTTTIATITATTATSPLTSLPRHIATTTVTTIIIVIIIIIIIIGKSCLNMSSMCLMVNF